MDITVNRHLSYTKMRKHSRILTKFLRSECAVHKLMDAADVGEVKSNPPLKNTKEILRPSQLAVRLNLSFGHRRSGPEPRPSAARALQSHSQEAD